MEAKGWLEYGKMMNGTNGGVFRVMYEKINVVQPDGSFEVENTPEGRAKFLQKYEKINTNWFKELFRPSIQHNHSLSMSTGIDKARFYASLSFLGDPGWSPTDDVKRFTANVNTAVDIRDWITLNFLVNSSMRQQIAPGTLSSTVTAEAGTMSRAFDINPFSSSQNSSRAIRPKDDTGDLAFY